MIKLMAIDKTRKYAPFYLDNLYIEPDKNNIRCNQRDTKVQPKVMEVLVHLCMHRGEIISGDQLVEACWPNQYISDSPIHKCIAQLRRALGDTVKNAKYIKTIPKRGYMIVANVSGIDRPSETQKPYWLHDAPYLGSSPYQEQHHNIFFGRDSVVKELKQWIDNKVNHQSSWLAISGAVGSGKTSLVQAGLLPLLSHYVLPSHFIRFNFNDCLTSLETSLEMTSGDRLTYQLIVMLIDNDILGSDKTPQQYIEIIEYEIAQAEKDSVTICSQDKLLANFLCSCLTLGESRYILFLDQLEVLFIEPNLKAAKQILHIINTVLMNGACMIISCVQQQYQIHLDHLIEETQTYTNDGDYRCPIFFYSLPEFSQNELIDIIQKPAFAAALEFEYNHQLRERLDIYLAHQIQLQPLSISIVQRLLEHLYNSRGNTTITFSALLAVNGIEGFISDIAEQSYQALTTTEKTQFEPLLFNLITINSTDKANAELLSVPLEHITHPVMVDVISHFISAGVMVLVTSENKPPKQIISVRLTHSGLLNHWFRIKTWLNNNISILYLRHDIKIATERWLTQHQNSDFLLTGKQPVTQAEQIRQNKSFRLSNDEALFIKRSNAKFSVFKKARNSLFSLLLVAVVGLTYLTVSIQQKNQQINQTRSNAENLISFILSDLKEKLEPIGKIELLNIVGSQTLEYFNLAGTDNLTGKSLIQWLDALSILGQVNIKARDYPLANAYFKQSKQAVENALLDDVNNIKLLEHAMLTNYWLGYLHYLNQDYLNAKPLFENYLTFANQLVKLEPHQVNWQLEQSYAFNNLGTLAYENAELTLADNYFEQSRRIKHHIFELDPTNLSAAIDLSDTLSWQASVKEKLGLLTIASQYYLEALTLARMVSESESNNIEFLTNLAILQLRVTKVFYDQSDLNSAIIHLENGNHSLKSLLLNDEDDFSLKEIMLGGFWQAARVYRHQRKYDQSLVFIEKANSLINEFKLGDKYSNTIIRYDIAMLIERSLVMSQLKQSKTALSTIEQAIQLHKSNVDQVPKDNYLYQTLLFTKLALLIESKEVIPTYFLDEYKKAINLLKSTLNYPITEHDKLSLLLAMVRQYELVSRDMVLIKEERINLIKSLKVSQYNIPDYANLLSKM